MIQWMNPARKLILASASPRRKQILTQIGFTFEVMPASQIEEKEYIDTEELEQSLRHLAVAKALEIARKNPAALVLGADTIVVQDKTVLGKPSNRDDAYGMLKRLSGNCHKVMTGVALICEEEHFQKSTVAVTDVYFRNIPDEEILQYLNHDEYLDKAGAYAIQGKALIFIDKIEGCYYNVVGLPVSGTITLFKDFIARKESANV